MSEVIITGVRLLSNKRAKVKGKFIYVGDEKFYIKGVTYGTFAPAEDGLQYPPIAVVEKDFSIMAQHGINCVRTYTVPPAFLLNIALAYDIKVMVGLPWEQHITFLDSEDRKKSIVERVKTDVLSCNQHPAILCYAIGNEIPAGIVRWYGSKKVENFLKTLYNAVKQIDPKRLVTYVNYPTTEYLDLNFLDFDCFNVYLESPEKLSAYIQRLHNLSGNRPLVLAEIGLDSRRNGEEQQAYVLGWQIETIFGKGCAGMFVFAWTDEWWRGGHNIQDWDFGLVDRERRPKPALETVEKAMRAVPFPDTMRFPFFSVIICSYNGAATIRDTLDGLMRMNYPAFEVIVINDGSTDNLADIVTQYNVKLISTPNRGLSSARNTGMEEATGEILAYIDDDAYPDDHWLYYLAYAYNTSSHAAIGGPNIIPPEDGPIATCVANAPGGPVHVLETDEIAEHVPGCNLTIRKNVLMEIGGFDPVYRAAGDDVDVCWRIQNAGYTIGFHPSALVWHHRRNSLKAYWKQQKGYGKAEALLEEKWPEKYNGFGHLAWSGRIYGNGFTLPINVKKGKVFHGTWGTALFQSVYEPAGGFLNSVPLMPEWFLMVGLLGLLSTMGILWAPLLWIFPFFVSAIVIVFVQAVVSAYQNTSLPNRKKSHPKYILLITALHIIQPMARLYGRLKHGLTPWRKMTADVKLKLNLAIQTADFNFWSEKWRSQEEWLSEIENNLVALKARTKRGGDFDRWDLQTRNGISSVSKAIFVIEEHGANKQFVKMKTWTRPTGTFILSFGFFTVLAVFAALDKAVMVSFILCLFPLFFFTEYLIVTSIAVHHLQKSLVFVGQKFNEAIVPLTVEERPFDLSAEISLEKEKVILDETEVSFSNEQEKPNFEVVQFRL